MWRTFPDPYCFIPATGCKECAGAWICHALAFGFMSFQSTHTFPFSTSLFPILISILFPYTNICIERGSCERFARWRPCHSTYSLTMSRRYTSCIFKSYFTGRWISFVWIESNCFIGWTGCQEWFFWVPSKMPGTIVMTYNMYVGLANWNRSSLWNTWQISYGFDFVRKTDIHRSRAVWQNL